MPINPRKGESHDDFISRCHEAEADAFPDSEQRHAICESYWDGRSDNQRSLASVFTVAQDIKTRTEMLDGVEHTVLPMVALVEGVFQCANCPEASFYPASEFGKQPKAWNGRPITLGHPMRNGAFVSAGSPSVWENERIGTVFNAHLSEGRLVVEAWVDPAAVERAGESAEAVMQAIEDGDQVEVSTGTFVEEQPRVGSFEGRSYASVQMNFQPDHIAILPLGTLGACNWEDGCGIRAAQAELKGMVLKNNHFEGENTFKTTCCDACARGEECTETTALETVRSREMALDMALEKMFPNEFVFVVDFDDQYVMYAGGGKNGIHRRSYTEEEGGNIVLGEDEERVRPRSEYVVVNSEEGVDGMADDKNAGVENESTPANASAAPAEVTGDHVAALTRALAEIEHLKSIVNKPPPKTAEEYVAAAPQGIQEILMPALVEKEKQKLARIDQIVAAQNSTFTKEQLMGMSADVIEQIAALSVAKTDYSIRQAGDSQLAAATEAGINGEGSFAPLPDASLWNHERGKGH